MHSWWSARYNLRPCHPKESITLLSDPSISHNSSNGADSRLQVFIRYQRTLLLPSPLPINPSNICFFLDREPRLESKRERGVGKDVERQLKEKDQPKMMHNVINSIYNEFYNQ